MKTGKKLKGFIYFLCVSFLLLVNRPPDLQAGGKNGERPVGEMISKGEVRFEVKENLWEKVETPFPIFEGMKIRTEKGGAALALAEKTRLEIGPNSLFCFDQRDQFNLLQGKISFKIQPDVQLRFKVGNLWIVKSYPLQTSRASSVGLSEGEEFMGSIFFHSKGSVTVKSLQGSLYVMNQDRVVLAGLSTRESITIPSIAVGSPPIRTAQRDVLGSEKLTETESEEFLGLSTWSWVGIGLAVAGVAGIVIAIAASDDDHETAVCP